MPQNKYEQTLDELVDKLDLVVREQVGDSLAEVMQRIRRLAIERRAGLHDAEVRLANEIKHLSSSELRAVIRWLSLFFDLANVVEECQRIDVLRSRKELAVTEGRPRAESIGSAVARLQQQGITASEMQTWLDRLRIEPVFTAHPSEAKRRTIRQLLRRIRQLVPAISSSQAESESELLANLTVLWQSDLVRPDRPPVMSEVSRGLYFASTLWDVVPKIYREIREALQASYPNHQFEIPRILSFASWIGGDRDGHPFVTSDVTRKTFDRLRRAALENHLAHCDVLDKQIVMSDQQIASDQPLSERIEQCCKRWPVLGKQLAPVSNAETYRKFLRTLRFRLRATLESGDVESGAFASLAEFQEDLELLRQSIATNRGPRIVRQYLQPWIDLVNTFGFQFAALDVRQNSEMHRSCLKEILASSGKGQLSDQESIEFVLQAEALDSIVLDSLSESSREVFDTLLLLAEKCESQNREAIGCYVISMTHCAADVMTVLWLWKAAWTSRGNSLASLPALPIVPLFETIEDLRNASRILEELFGNTLYQQYVAIEKNPQQVVMVGYSDSTKDGGYLTACWELHQAQQNIAMVADQHRIQLTVFHGRGGSIGRGGGPAARAILSLPPAAVDGKLRVTEQGEVLSERYDDPTIAHRHLEQMINATLLVSALPGQTPEDGWMEAIELLSAESFGKYRELVQHPEFLHYFENATPISEIETLPIGSRPARRGRRTSLSDLRAIPWTFAWTQSRHMLPAWFGLGSAIRSYVDSQDPDWTRLQAMYKRWPMFTALIDNAELALAKADMEIAKSYASLIEDDSTAVWDMISKEFKKSRGAILLIKGNNELLAGIDWLRASVSNRNPYVDPLNLTQIHILRRIRNLDEKDEQFANIARLSIQGIAAGLRTTG